MIICNNERSGKFFFMENEDALYSAVKAINESFKDINKEPEKYLGIDLDEFFENEIYPRIPMPVIYMGSPLMDLQLFVNIELGEFDGEEMAIYRLKFM